MRPRSRLVLTGIAGLAAITLASCSSGSSGSSTPSTMVAPTRRPAPTSPYAVGRLTVTLVDTSRPTAAHAGVPATPSRTLVTTILYPAVGQPGPAQRRAPANIAAGPFPMVVFAHGTDGEPADFGALFTSWAAAGYVVVAPEFPLTGEHVAGGSIDADYVNQPADVRFLIDQMLHSPPGQLAGVVDAGRIAVAGHSLGGVTTVGLAFNTCCLDPRVKAVIVMAGAPLSYSGGTYFGSVRSPPALFIQGSADQTVVPQTSVGMYNRARPPKALVTIVGGTHSGPYEGDQLTAQVSLVSQVSIDFMNLFLYGRPDGAATLRQTVASSNGQATLQESGL